MRNYLSALAIAAAAVMTVMAAEKPPEAHVKLMKRHQRHGDRAARSRPGEGLRRDCR